MSSIEKTERINLLFDIYENLLTSHQIQVFQSYYQDDLSLKEIAEDLDISRNAVHDVLKRVEIILEDYESKLHLLDKIEEINDILENHEELKKRVMKVLNR